MTVLNQAVVDASVVFKWQFGDEEYIEQASKLRDDYYMHGVVKVIAPDLLMYELANGIVVAARRERIAYAMVYEAMDNLVAWNIELREVDNIKSIEFALQYGLSGYDAAYVVLARSENCELWTGDKPLYQAVKDELPFVKWIGDYPGL